MSLLPDLLPVLPLRATVVFPGVTASMVVGDPALQILLRDAMARDAMVALVTQRSDGGVARAAAEVYGVGTWARITEATGSRDDMVRVTVEGLQRIRLRSFVDDGPYLLVRPELAAVVPQRSIEVEALARAARGLFTRLAADGLEISGELALAAEAFGDPMHVAYFIASVVPLAAEGRQAILEGETVADQLRRLIELLQHELAVRRIADEINLQTTQDLAKAQREQILRRQLETIERELEGGGGEDDDWRDLERRLAAAGLPDEARRECERELGRGRRMSPLSPERDVVRTYLDWVLRLPWGRPAREQVELAAARRVLDHDHFGLERIKERILEYLAVRLLRERAAARGRPAPPDDAPEPILCLLGPPGVGKTSLGHSVARALGRGFARVSLGGIHDEAEIRGHRRTYVASMPGRILQAIARAGAPDPVFMLDEVDKLGVGFHGDPSAALLEVLDPVQNRRFLDTYLGVPFDLSNVLFLCTANSLDGVPPALHDRLEVLRIPGYSDTDKLEIARRHLMPRQLLAHGLDAAEVAIEDDAVRRMMREYTREAGVRGLEREIATILRKAARQHAEGRAEPLRVTTGEVRGYLGPRRFFDEVCERIDRPGVATGLAWTPAGGEVLFVEASAMSGRSRLVLTGMLGDVMRESAQAALAYLRASASRLGLDERVLRRHVHVHVPGGAVPKDGPSAGLAILVALASLATGRPVVPRVGVTGEVTLRGKILPVGGIKEKLLAAHRAGVARVLLPRHNQGAVEELPEELRALELVWVDSADEALAQVLEPAAAPAPAPCPPAEPPLH